MSIEDLWVGKPEGSQMMFVFDKRMEHEDPSMVYLFSAHSGSMKEYEKRFARYRLKTVQGLEREDAIKSYLSWHGKMVQASLNPIVNGRGWKWQNVLRRSKNKNKL